MNKTKFVPFALGAFLALSGVAFAQESATVPSVLAPQNARGVIQNIRPKAAGVKEAVKNARKDIKTDARDLRADTKDKMMAATSSAERRAIEKNAIEERKEIISERKANTSEIRDQRKDLIEARKASSTEIRDQRKDQRKELARGHLVAITRRYEIAVKQFENLAGRIQSRIDKMKTAGADTSSAESALGTALSIIAQLKADAQALKDAILQIDSGTDTRTIRAQIETAVRKASASVKAAHKALQTAVKALVSLARLQKTATSTNVQ